MRSLAARGVPALALLVVLVALAAAGGAAQDDAPAETMRIDLEPDGDARWTVTMRFQLESSNETEGFDRIAAEYEAGESDHLSADPYREAAKQASRATGRSMEIRNVSRNAWRSDDTGRLELSFIWTSFANRSADRMLLGDVFQADSGTWLPRLDAGQQLVVEFPEEYAIVDSSHRLEDRAFDIRGPTTFEPGTPSAALVRGRTPTTVVTPTDPMTGSPGTGDGTIGITTEPPAGGSWQIVGVGALVVLVGTLALLVERRRRSGRGPVPADGGDDGRPGGAVEAGEDGGAAAPAGEPGDEPLLSDDERVLRLLHQNDGRMKQARIVEETGWSNAKVSQLLSEMAEGEKVDKLRIGRENLISLPGEGPNEGE